jgi:hypothetical protein
MPPKKCSYCFYLYGQACGERPICLLDKQPVETPAQSSCAGWYPTRQYLAEADAEKQTSQLLQQEREGK